ncbi:uncharacterized protein LOC128958526 [Oppia nitens]|uniref:uncharacterized protein LOC128958526 n=1 Tax=Oppia nitens TaxID=1686743 RepID=UPI0023DBC6DD|nr:uncharacterized protein LOC128958526 [Oppia nitens]
MTNSILYITLLVCTVLGYTVALYRVNSVPSLLGRHQSMKSLVGNTTEDCDHDACCKKVIDDIVKCVFKKISQDDIEKYKDSRKFLCCLLGVEFDCAEDIGKEKCGTDYDRFKKVVETDKDVLNKNECKEFPVKTGSTKCVG